MEWIIEGYKVISQEWVILLCCFTAAAFRELMEHSRDDKFDSSFWGNWFTIHFLNTGNKGKGESWLNKWKLDDEGNPIPCIKAPWYYLGLFRPEYEERFIFSSTFFVFLTDAEHLFQFLSTCSACIAVGFAANSVESSVIAFTGFVSLGFVKEIFFPQVS